MPYSGYSDRPPALPPPRTQQRKVKTTPTKPESFAGTNSHVSKRALPPLPPHTNDSLGHKEGSSGNFNSFDDSTQRKSLTLTDFVKKHSQALPLRVCVTEGFCGNDARYGN